MSDNPPAPNNLPADHKSHKRHKKFFKSHRHKPVEIGHVKDLEDLFERIQRTTTTESDNWSRRAHDWGTLSVTLAVLSALGSGAAGATVAGLSTLNGSNKTIIVIFSFAGAVLAGVAAAVGAPSQAKDASLKSDQLASLERWASLSIVEYPSLTHDERLERSRELLAWRDQIFGISTPKALRSGVDVRDPGSGS